MSAWARRDVRRQAERTRSPSMVAVSAIVLLVALIFGLAMNGAYSATDGSGGNHPGIAR